MDEDELHTIKVFIFHSTLHIQLSAPSFEESSKSRLPFAFASHDNMLTLRIIINNRF